MLQKVLSSYGPYSFSKIKAILANIVLMERSRRKCQVGSSRIGRRHKQSESLIDRLAIRTSLILVWHGGRRESNFDKKR